MGGKVAMVLALRHPEMVRRLAILDIAPTTSDASQSEFAHLLSSLATLDLTKLERRVDAHELLREAIPNDTVRGFLLQNLKRTDTGFEWEPNLRLLNAEIDAVTAFPDMSGHEFAGPVLWMRGERSDYVRDEDAELMRSLFPKTRRMTVREAGHWVHSEKPDEVIAALRGFFLSGIADA
jgi:pimeloyl-ACP methyl ester carboxylesterase